MPDLSINIEERMGLSELIGPKKERVLLTGGAGFIGSHFVESLIKNTNWEIIIWDKLTYASNGLDRLRDIKVFNEKRVLILTVDFTLPISEGVKKETGNVDYVFHLGAETNVDNSILNPEPFVMSNVIGTMNILNYARELRGLKLLFNFNTDEVFGPAPDRINYKETDAFNPTNPYSAAKVGQWALGVAYHNTYGLPVINTFCMNVFGERQHKEKFIPKTINCVLEGKPLTIHSKLDDNGNVIEIGSRKWIHARNVADALLFLTRNGKTGEGYNIVSAVELNNLELAQKIADIIGKSLKIEYIDFHKCRKGHDRRYSLDGSKMKKMGWKPPVDFEDSLKKCVLWTLGNEKWLW